MKKSNKIVIGVIIVLAVVIAASAIPLFLNMDTQNSSLKIIVGEETLAEYTLDEIEKMSSVDVEKELTSSNKQTEEGTFTGVPLEIILSAIDSDWENKYSEFILTASDGFSSAVSLADILEGENVLIVYEKDREALGEDVGPLRAIVVNDPFGNRSTFHLNKIELQ